MKKTKLLLGFNLSRAVKLLKTEDPNRFNSTILSSICFVSNTS